LIYSSLKSHNPKALPMAKPINAEEKELPKTLLLETESLLKTKEDKNLSAHP